MKLIKNMMLISLGLAFASPAFANDTLKVQTIKQLYATEIYNIKEVYKHMNDENKIKKKSIDKFFDTTFLKLNAKAKQIPNKSNELPPEHPDFDPYEDFGLGEISLTPADGAGDFGYNPKIKMIDYKVDKNNRVIATGWIISTDGSNIKQKFTTAFELKCSQTQCKITDLHDDTDGYYNGKFRSRKAYLIERIKRG